MLIVSILLVVSFVGIAIWRKRELPESISAMVFDMKQPWLWSVWLWAVTITLAPSLIDSIPEPWKVFGFFCLACLMFVGVVPLFDTEHRKWHYVLGFIAGVLSQACVWYICPWWLLLWLPMIGLCVAALLGYNDSKDIPSVINGKGVFIAECICYVSLVLAILIH